MKRLYTFVISLLCGILAVNAQETFIANNLVYSVNDDGVLATVTGHVDGYGIIKPNNNDKKTIKIIKH